MELLLENFKYYNEHDTLVENHSFLIKNGIIDKIIEGKADNRTASVNLDGNLLTPGFIDLQVNGGAEVFFTHSITQQTLEQMYTDHLKFGTTNMLATLVTTSPSNIIKAIKEVREYINKGKPGIIGMHLEGPFIDYEKRGAHNPSYIRKPTDDELKNILKEGKEVIKIITIAPEVFSDYQIELIKESGITIFAGHSNTSNQSAVSAFDKGIKGVTHLYNAMSQMTSREPGLVGAALSNDVYAGIIVDGLHCNYTNVKLAYKLKRDKLFLVSDATFIGKKNLEMDGIKFIYKPDPGCYVNTDGNLAGSNITMLNAVRNCVYNADIPLPKAIKMATTIPAKILSVENKYGRLKEGCAADLLVLSSDNLELKRIVHLGEISQIQ